MLVWRAQYSGFHPWHGVGAGGGGGHSIHAHLPLVSSVKRLSGGENAVFIRDGRGRLSPPQGASL